jgi:hypothetical protein
MYDLPRYVCDVNLVLVLGKMPPLTDTAGLDYFHMHVCTRVTNFTHLQNLSRKNSSFLETLRVFCEITIWPFITKREYPVDNKICAVCKGSQFITLYQDSKYAY